MAEKRISVLMGIYNCADTLPDAIECILKQTVTDWELILCDDGSVDDTYSVAKRYQKQYSDRIRLLKNEQNMGLNYTLNHCLAYATGEFIARMDGDDLCSADRFEKELRALEEHPEMAVVSTEMAYFDGSGIWGYSHAIPQPQNMDFIKGTPFCHAPCMARREIINSIGGYTDDPKYLRVEDYDLWVKLYAAGHRGMNLQEPLYQMRDDRNAFARRKLKYRVNETRVICKAVRLLKLPVWCYLRAAKPIAVGLLPPGLYKVLHKGRLSHKKEN
jgi:glycosyltransferase EpsE